MMHTILQAAGLDSIFVTAVTSDSLLVSHLLNWQETKRAKSKVAAWQSHFGGSLLSSQQDFTMSIREMAVRGSTGKRRVTRSIPDRRTLLVDSLLLCRNKPGWL